MIEQIATTQERILTIGYAEPGAEERIAAFLSQKNTLLLDIRKDPLSRWRPAFRRGALTMRYSAQYRWFPEFGNLNHKAADRHKGIALADPDAGLKRVIRLLDGGYSIMLMCACKSYEACHRKVVYDLTAQALWERERRRLFISLMRKPEMRLVRLALRSINWCAGLDWHDIEEVGIDPPHDLKACWSLDTPEYFVHCLSPEDNRLTYDDFTLWYRCTGEPGCKCYFCSYPSLAKQEAMQDESAQFSDGFFFHAYNADGKRLV